MFYIILPSSEDDDDKSAKRNVIDDDEDSNQGTIFSKDLMIFVLVSGELLPLIKIQSNLRKHNILDEHRVQRYGDDHPEAIEGESGSASASVSPKGRGIVLSI